MNRSMGLTIVVLLALSASATDYYVDGDNGSDAGGSYDGLSETYAFATINTAVAAASDGDTIYVQNNGSTVYTELVSITNIGIRLIGYGTGLDDGTLVPIDGEDTRANCILSTRSNTVVSNPMSTYIANFELYGATGVGLWLNRTTGIASCQLYNVVVRDNGGTGVYAATSYYLYAYGCTFADNGSHGAHTNYGMFVNCLASGNTSYGFSLYLSSAVRCVSVDNGGYGFRLSNDGGCVINCIADSNGSDGFYTTSVYGWTIRCIAIRNSGYGVNNASKGGVTIGCYFGDSGLANTSGATTGAMNVDSTTISADPFTAIYNSSTNAAWEGLDYRVTSGSALFDVLQPVGGLDNDMQAYSSIGPKVQNPAASGSVVIYPVRRHGN